MLSAADKRRSADWITAGLGVLSVNGVLSTGNLLNSSTPMGLYVQGSGIASVEVSVFNMAGRLVAQHEALGQALSFYALDKYGRTLANGVYLYIVQAVGYDGKVIRTER